MTLAEILSALAAIGALYSIWNQRRYIKAQAALTFSQADSNNIKDALSLKDEYKKALAEIRAELEHEQKERANVETKLAAANELIADLQAKDRKREAAMNDLQAQFDRDSLLRASIEKALVIANEKIRVLEDDKRAISERVSALENERRTWRRGIGMLIDQVMKHNEEPIWRPPDTQPLGKLTTS